MASCLQSPCSLRTPRAPAPGGRLSQGLPLIQLSSSRKLRGPGNRRGLTSPISSHHTPALSFCTAASLSSLDQPPTHLFYVKALEATLSNSSPAHICSSEAGFKVCMGECAPDCILRKVKRRWSTTQEEARV